MPASTRDLLMDLLEEQEDALRAVKKHCAIGEDLSSEQMDGLLMLQQQIENTRMLIGLLIEGSADFYMAQEG